MQADAAHPFVVDSEQRLFSWYDASRGAARELFLPAGVRLEVQPTAAGSFTVRIVGGSVGLSGELVIDARSGVPVVVWGAAGERRQVTLEEAIDRLFAGEWVGAEL